MPIVMDLHPPRRTVIFYQESSRCRRRARRLLSWIAVASSFAHRFAPLNSCQALKARTLASAADWQHSFGCMRVVSSTRYRLWNFQATIPA